MAAHLGRDVRVLQRGEPPWAAAARGGLTLDAPEGRADGLPGCSLGRCDVRCLVALPQGPPDSHLSLFASYSFLVKTTLAGTPSTTTPGGASFVTTAPIATTLSRPPVPPALMTDPPPMTAPSSMVTPTILLLMG